MAVLRYKPEGDSMIQKNTQICVVGLWHLGTVTAACLAEFGFNVIGVDEDAARIDRLNEGSAPLFEPGLDDLLQSGIASGRLRFTSSYSEGLQGSSFVWIAYDTPVNDQDEVDLTIIVSAINSIAAGLEDGATVIVHSQVPAGTCEQLRDSLHAARPDCAIGLACIPENLRLGRALERFRNPAMIVIGSDEKTTLDRVEEFCSVFPCPKVRLNLRGAEMTKHAINSYLATCVSYINELANLCDAAGADASKVSQALRMDERVSPAAPLLPGGLGFAGATLARDLRALQKLGKRVGHPTHLFDAVLQVNEEQKRIVRRRLQALFGSLEGLSIGILGLTYKTGTSTLRRSAAIEIARELRKDGVTVQGYDPKAAIQELGGDDVVHFCSAVEDVARNSDALVIVTEWPEFKELDFEKLGMLMKHRILIDTKNLLDPVRLRQLGFIYSDIGRGTEAPQALNEDGQRSVVCA
jgi:UDPglucose 6-dehydrogenase